VFESLELLDERGDVDAQVGGGFGKGGVGHRGGEAVRAAPAAAADGCVAHVARHVIGQVMGLGPFGCRRAAAAGSWVAWFGTRSTACLGARGLSAWVV
jgi:hypothetical protein